MGSSGPASAAFELLITNGKVVDGAGNPWFYGDVALRGDRIAAVAPRGSLDPAQAREVFDAAGHVVCPGFIDIQSHSIGPFWADGRSVSKVTQGVTTEIMGESRTPAPMGGRISKPALVEEQPEWAERARTWTRFRPWLEALEARGVSVNIGSFVGGGTIREYGCGWDMRPATTAEVETMCRVMDECMRDGAFGIAPALIYPPGSFAGTDELVELARVTGRYGGVYITHIRSEGAGLLPALGEAIEIGRRGPCAIEIYHLKASGQSHWHLMPQAIAMIDQARRDGVDIAADMYPYVASGTGLSALIPQWACEGNRLYENMADPQVRAKLKSEMLDPSEFGQRTAGHVMPLGFKLSEHQAFAGQRLDEIARQRGQDWTDAVMDLLVVERQRIFTVYFSMSEENVALQLRQPWIKISTDAGGIDPGDRKPLGHPRGFGTYPRVLGRYVRELGVLSLEDAIRKMTSAVAARLGLHDRGTLKPGQFADVVVFDPAVVSDRATFTEPWLLSEGIREVWVNGTRVLQGGCHTGALPGRIVDGPGRRP